MVDTGQVPFAGLELDGRVQILDTTGRCREELARLLGTDQKKRGPT